MRRAHGWSAHQTRVNERTEALNDAGLIRLVATDLDGTLLRPDGTFSPRTQDALAAARAAGMTIVFVSARSPRSISVQAAEVGVTGFAVCANGAITYDLERSEIVEHHALEPAVAERLVLGIRERAPGTSFACERELVFSCEPLYDQHNPYADRDFDYVRADAIDLVRSPLTKLIVRHPGVPLVQLADAVTTLAGTDAAVTFSGEHFVEVSAPGVTKAFAVERLCRRLDVASAEVVAFGDMPNDLPLLAWAGHSVAVANAHPDVLAAADERTASNADDGVALVLERLIASP